MKTPKLCLLAVPFFLALSGCLTSQEPFYQETDIRVDDRLVGFYHAENEQTSWHIEKDLDQGNRYHITLISDAKPCFMRFRVVLFQAGKNRFLDMQPMLDACDHVAGGPPSPLEILQGLTLQPLHMAVKVEISTNGVKFGCANHRDLVATARRFPEYFQPPKPEQSPRMVADTKRQREFLLRFGGDTNIFKPSEIRRETQPLK